MKFFTVILAFILVFAFKGISQEQDKRFFPKEFKPGEIDYDNPLRREEEFVKQRAYPNSEIPQGARIKAINQMEKMYYEKNSPTLMLAEQPEWKNIGPFSVGGRIKTIVCHPTKPGVVFVGGAAGGVWKSTDYGASWTPIFDSQNALAFGSLAIDVTNPDVMYAGTGEAVVGGNSYLGDGMFKTTDGGNTWKVLGLTDVGAFSKVWVHPLNPNFIVAGAVKRSQGFYKSTDAGQTWTKTFDGPVSDISINFKNVNEILIGVTGLGIYFSNDGGDTWQQENAGLDAGIGRVSVQFAPSNPDIAYALMEISGNGTIYKSTNHGKGWITSYRGDATFFNGQGFYDNYIVVHPTNPNIAIAGGIDIWRTTDGTNWTNRTNGYSGGSVHVDQHHACFDPTNSNTVYFGNDGGMYKSIDGGSNFAEINNNLQVTQFYSEAIDLTQSDVTYGGTQDNGTLGKFAAQNDWQGVFGGDGFRTFVDVTNHNLIYGESYIGNMVAPFRINVANGGYAVLSNGLAADGVWDPPLVQDPLNNSIIYHGRTKLYATYNNGDIWEVISPSYLANFVTAIAVSPANDSYIIAGTDIGQVIITTDGGNTWSDVTANGLVNRWVRHFAFSKTDANTIWAVFSGFGVPHVFKTTDAGKTWNSISEGLPDIPTNAIAVHPTNENMIFVGTDIGVFATFDGGKSWFPYGRGLSRSPVTDLQFNTFYAGQASIPLRAATHGRSIWQVDVTEETITSPEIVAPAGGELFTSGVPQVVSWYGFTPPVLVEYSVDDGASWTKIAENVQGNNLMWIVPNRPTVNARIRVTSLTDQSQVRISNPFTILLVEIGSILKMGGVSFVPYGISFDGKDGLWTTSFKTNQLTKLNADNFLLEKQFTLPGDSMFTDIGMDRQNGILYIQRMYTSDVNSEHGGIILVVDTTGTVIAQYTSPGKAYPIGLEYIDGKLLCGDRDYRNDYNMRTLIWADPQTGKKLSELDNPYQQTYGPRGLCYDQKEYVYQVCTDFPNGGSLAACYVLKMDKSDVSTEISRMPLESLDGIINARGIDYDPRDKNFWVTDYGGNIYKVAGFETITKVQEDNITIKGSSLDTKVYPNPVTDFATISLMLTSGDFANVNVKLYNIIGEEVSNLLDKNLSANEYANVTVSTTNLPAGVYNIVFFVNGMQDVTRKLVVVK